MRSEMVEARTVVPHAAKRVWEVLADPEQYPRVARGITWCRHRAGTAGRKGARYEVRLATGDGAVSVEDWQVRDHRPGERIAFSGGCGEGYRASVTLRPTADGDTEITVVLAWPGGAPPVAALSEQAVRKRLAEAGRVLADALTGGPESSRREGLDRAGAAPHGEGGSLLQTAGTLSHAGVLRLARPGRTLRQWGTLRRWGATLAGGYAAAAEREPDGIAYVDERGARTFAELDDRATRLALGLAERGLAAGSVAALLCRNHGGLVEALLACGKLGANTLLLNTGLSAEQVGAALRGHDVAALLADDEFAPVVGDPPAGCPVLGTWPASGGGSVFGDTVGGVIARTSPGTIRPPSEPGRVIVLTSGTTGTPKGARRPTPKGLSDAAAVLSRIPIRVGDRLLVAAPLFHTWGLAALQLAMPLRAPVTLRRRFDAEDVLGAVAEQRCTALFAVPVMVQRIMELPARVRARYDTSTLRVVASSGSALPSSLVESFTAEFGDVLYNLYGSTEVSWAAIADPADLRAAPTTAGRCPFGTRLRIRDADGTPLPTGVTGDIDVGNDMLFDGYTDRSGQLPRQGLLNTGDRGYVDANGRLFVVGRADEMIDSGGEIVYPGPVEDLLARLPEVLEVAVLGVPDREYGRRLAAYIVPRPGATLDAATVRGYVHDRLPRFAVPRDVVFLDHLPRNATGKIVKRYLPEL